MIVCSVLSVVLCIHCSDCSLQFSTDDAGVADVSVVVAATFSLRPTIVASCWYCFYALMFLCWCCVVIVEPLTNVVLDEAMVFVCDTSLVKL